MAGRNSREKNGWRSFALARDWARSQGLKNREGWKKLSLPLDIPRNPYQVYIFDWTNWGDFLGTGNLRACDRVFLSFEEARRWASSSGIKTSTQWRSLHKSGDVPSEIPYNPDFYYKDEWAGWPDWLGTGKMPYRHRNFLPFEEARQWVIDSGARSHSEWKKLDRPESIPSAPWSVYKEWVSWGHWFGTGRVADQFKVYKSFEDARSWAKDNGVTSQTQWAKAKIPSDVPRSPRNVYSEEWQGWGHFLGTGHNRRKRNEVIAQNNRDLRILAKPEWAKYPQIRPFIEHARLMTKTTGILHSVDHIDPIAHSLVCGLHVPANLRVMPMLENVQKRNMFKPYSFDGQFYTFFD